MSSKDQFAAELEFIWSEMARVAGLEMPETRLFRDNSENSHFGIKRFDRETNNQRFHVHSFGNLIESDFRIPNCDYTELLKATAYLTRDQREVAKAFRLATFNVLSHNRDDHVKNVAFIQDFATGEWRLTPAFDLTFSAGPGGQHSMTVCGEGVAPGEAELLQLASLVNLDKSLSHQIITDVKNAVSLFPKFAEVHGISKKRRREICQILAL
jgi:serine/threonine-protein kinase HipA